MVAEFRERLLGVLGYCNASSFLSAMCVSSANRNIYKSRLSTDVHMHRHRVSRIFDWEGKRLKKEIEKKSV